ncbi:MAG: hypothetical protein UT55_C0020G0001 [Candidatus Peregrinibacteria bacterium GW2011_GWE2_39_6]|nr:MAG: hypothetical protein UT36_C0015G0001 [Candidatus Peregrinibacteria bacterium GW2011_GWF2_39_17]KKR26026.1 MAG: hypothetical protein UT55_C0020G0001 [Candidatus Peregrinibacteria bacterium GW2011_GWE2_39_6]HCW32047.1 hypothetical protein [Candidatus Peregrinibacteria bacterium]
MKVIVSNKLAKKEQIQKEKIEIIQAYAKGIFTKIYTTTIRGGAGRIVFLVDAKSNDGFFLFFRSKNDPIGKNITIKNLKFKNQLHKYLQILKDDIVARNYEVFEVN